MSLCSTCLSCLHGNAPIITDYRDSSKSQVVRDEIAYQHHNNAFSFQDSATLGCRLCKVLFKTVESNRAKRTHVVRPGEHGPEHKKFNVLCSVAVKNRDTHMAEIEMRCQRPDMMDISVPFNLFTLSGETTRSVSTGSESSLATAREWVTDCAQNHLKCNHQDDKEWLPTRLLDLSQSDEFRLIDSHGLALGVKYVTLSHCWGKGKMLKLTTSTEKMLREGCNFDILPRTFRETMEVCKFLGINYVWIDSLCIIQEDQDDWLKESIHMGEVYANAFCNIAADDSQDGSGGLFRDRKPFDVLHLTSSPIIPAGTYSIAQDYLWNNKVARASLNRRAWVLQERMLAKRVIHFTEDEIFWECGQGRKSELFPDGLPNPYNYDQLIKEQIASHRDVANAATAAPIDPEWKSSWMEVRRAWDEIKMAYSNSLLTVATDRVVALAGVAKDFEGLLKDSYVAGMWKSRLVEELVWHVDQEGPDRLPIGWDRYRAPSFSWLSVETPVVDRPFLPIRDYLFEIVDLELQHVTANSAGPIKGGYILLLGLVRPIQIEYRAEEPRRYRRWKVWLQGEYVDHIDIMPSMDYGRADLTSSKRDEHFCIAAAGNDGKVWCFLLELLDQGGIYRRIGLGAFDKAVFENLAARWDCPSIHHDVATRRSVIRVV